MSSLLNNTDAVILCGGKGTRLKSLTAEKPKILVPVGGRPLMDTLLTNLSGAGFRRIILGVGHLKHKIREYLQENEGRYGGISIEISEEETPLGTGGGLKKAGSLVKSDEFLVMNGDIIFNLNFEKFYQFHGAKKGKLSMALTHPQAENEYGGVSVDAEKRITGFKEKDDNLEGKFINAGIYFMNRELLPLMPSGQFSLEHDFFPKMIGGGFYGFVAPGRFIDIGTPGRYAKANKEWDRILSDDF